MKVTMTPVLGQSPIRPRFSGLPRLSVADMAYVTDDVDFQGLQQFALNALQPGIPGEAAQTLLSVMMEGSDFEDEARAVLFAANTRQVPFQMTMDHHTMLREKGGESLYRLFGRNEGAMARILEGLAEKMGSRRHHPESAETARTMIDQLAELGDPLAKRLQGTLD